MIAVKNLSLAIAGNTILNNVSLEVSPGDIYNISGKNGSGKTSLLKCITGIYDFYDGDISINNEAVNPTNIKQYAPYLSFFIDKNFSYPYLTVSDNLKVFRYYNKVESYCAELDALIDAFGLKPLYNTKVAKLSAGFKHKTELIIALMNEGKFILLDEPSVNLDHGSIQVFYQYIKTSSQNHSKAYVVVSHNDVELNKIANKHLSL